MAAICYRNIPTFHILQEDLDLDKDLKKRFIIITMNCRNIIYMHWVLARLLTETGVQSSTLYYQTEEANFSLFRKISTIVTVKFGNRCFLRKWVFTDMNFFRAVSDSCFRISFISDSENHKSHDYFFIIFSISIKVFYGFEE